MQNKETRKSFEQRFEIAMDKLASLPLVFVTKAGIFIVPAIPAIFVAISARENLDVSLEFAILIAIGLEIAGLSAVHGALVSYNYELGRLKTDLKAPMKLHLVTVLVYYVVVLSVVLIIELIPSLSLIIPAAFVVLGASTSLVIALNYSHQQKVALALTKKQARKVAITEAKGNSKPTWMKKVPQTKQEFLDYVADGTILLPKNIGIGEFSNYVPVSRRSARNWLNSIR